MTAKDRLLVDYDVRQPRRMPAEALAENAAPSREFAVDSQASSVR